MCLTIHSIPKCLAGPAEIEERGHYMSTRAGQIRPNHPTAWEHLWSYFNSYFALYDCGLNVFEVARNEGGCMPFYRIIEAYLAFAIFACPSTWSHTYQLLSQNRLPTTTTTWTSIHNTFCREYSRHSSHDWGFIGQPWFPFRNTYKNTLRKADLPWAIKGSSRGIQPKGYPLNN